MIEFFKLKSLPAHQRHRKIIRLLESIEKSHVQDQADLPDVFYVQQLFKIILQEPLDSATIARIQAWLRNPCKKNLLPLINHIRHELYVQTGVTAAEWDLIMPDMLPQVPRFFFKDCFVFAEDIRTPFNVGSIFRTAESFGVEKIFLSEYCASPEQSRAKRTAMGCIDFLPWQRTRLEELPKNIPLIALETGGENMYDFVFPQKGILLIGSEELGLSPEALKKAESVITIPMHGIKASLNVGVAFGICMSRWVQFLATN